MLVTKINLFSKTREFASFSSPAAMKLSFNSAKKAPKLHQKPPLHFSAAVDGGDDNDINPTNRRPSSRHYVTEFDPNNQTLTDHSKTLIIPPKPNEWRPSKRMKNLDAPFRDPSDPSDLARFESSSLTKSVEDEAKSGLSYGLTIRHNPPPNNQGSGEDVNLSDGEGEEEREDLREQLEKLGDDPGEKEYEDVAVEDFAKALMAGYGWKEGMGIGRNVKGDVKVKQIERRGGREGLGFKEFDVKGSVKSMDSRESPREEPAPMKVTRGSGVEESWVRLGDIVRVVGGGRQDLVGMKGKVVEVRGRDESVFLRISKSNEEVKIRLRDVAELGSAEEERCLRKLKELRISAESNGSTKISRDEAKSVGGKRGWLTNHIRVRIINKELKGGRLYKKKGEVVDVVGPTSCNILLDESKELVQGINQEYLETALPKRGGLVFVLSGRYKGVLGNLVERDLDKETGVVRDFDTHELIDVRLEQIAEYVGDLALV